MAKRSRNQNRQQRTQAQHERLVKAQVSEPTVTGQKSKSNDKFNSYQQSSVPREKEPLEKIAEFFSNYGAWSVATLSVASAVAAILIFKNDLARANSDIKENKQNIIKVTSKVTETEKSNTLILNEIDHIKDDLSNVSSNIQDIVKNTEDLKIQQAVFLSQKKVSPEPKKDS